MIKIKMPETFRVYLRQTAEEHISYIINWIQENIEGKYLVDESDLVEVFGTGLDCGHAWYKEKDPANYKAYLIKSSIQAIKKDTVDYFREWEKTHNKENYGRYDAFKAGYMKALEAEHE